MTPCIFYPPRATTCPFYHTWLSWLRAFAFSSMPHVPHRSGNLLPWLPCAGLLFSCASVLQQRARDVLNSQRTWAYFSLCVTFLSASFLTSRYLWATGTRTHSPTDLSPRYTTLPSVLPLVRCTLFGDVVVRYRAGILRVRALL